MPLEAIQQKLAQREIGLLHQVFHEGRWLTLREFLEAQEAKRREEERLLEERARLTRKEEERNAGEQKAKQQDALMAEKKRGNDLLEASLKTQVASSNAHPPAGYVGHGVDVQPGSVPVASSNAHSPAGYPSAQFYHHPPKSRGVYIILGLFLGLLGIHNFYAGYHGRGAIQLILTLTLIGAIITALWSLIELLTVVEDASGVRMT
jgi:hypothetical protein